MHHSAFSGRPSAVSSSCCAGFVFSLGGIFRLSWSYGEGLYPIDLQGDFGRGSILELSRLSGEPLDCQQLQSRSSSEPRIIDVKLHCRLPSVPVNQPPKLCAVVTVRSSDAHAWWYMIPPPPTSDQRTVHCTKTVPDYQKAAASTGGIGFLEFDIPLNLSLPVGFSKVSARMELDSFFETSPLIPESHILVWVNGNKQASRSKMESTLRHACASARSEDVESRSDALSNAGKLSSLYDSYGLRLHPYLALQRGGEAEFHKLLDPELLAALQDGSPAALWGMLSGSDHSTPCKLYKDRGACANGVFTFPVFRPEVAKDLIAEIQHAKQSVLRQEFSLPTNFHDIRKEHTGVILDELGLGLLAKFLVSKVLAPLARLVHPDWAPWQINSYHAFSIHKGISVDSEQEENRRRHMDVCESSMNICLGEEGFTGSGVQFGSPPKRGHSPFADDGDGFSVEHIPGRAFLNLCAHMHGVEATTSGQRHGLVVRGISSHLRRSPAELFHEHCMHAEPFDHSGSVSPDDEQVFSDDL